MFTPHFRLHPLGIVFIYTPPGDAYPNTPLHSQKLYAYKML